MSPPMWNLTMFGTFSARYGDTDPVSLKGPKNRRVLAYLALSAGKLCALDVLAKDLWPSATDPKHSAVVAISSLRKELEKERGLAHASVLDDQPSGFVTLRPGAIQTDFQQFTLLRPMARFQDDRGKRVECLLEAAALHKAPLCEGIEGDTFARKQREAYEGFLADLEEIAVLLPREQIRSKLFPLLERAVQLNKQIPPEDGSFPTAPYLLLIKLHLDFSERAKARSWCTKLRIHHREHARLEYEKRVADLAIGETEPDDLFRDVLDRESRELVLLAERTGPHDIGSPLDEKLRIAVSLQRTLPPRLSHFFGREREILEIAGMLRGKATPIPGVGTQLTPNKRLITVTGFPGDGKTRLAAEVAVTLADAFADRVGVVVPETAGTLCHDIAQAVGIATAREEADDDIVDDIADLLKDHATLIILDDLERLMYGVLGLETKRRISLLLQRVPCLHLLVTSRIAIGIEGEQEYPILGLSTPPEGASQDEQSSHAGVAMFMDRAREDEPGRNFSPKEITVISDICRAVEGGALAIELLAQSAVGLSLDEINKQLRKRQSEILVSSSGESGRRMQSLTASLGFSFDLLAPSFQRFFVGLAIFSGGWTAIAAEAVLDEPSAKKYLHDLRPLVEIVPANEHGVRYRMREVAHEFASDKLEPARREHLAAVHADYYRCLIARNTTDSDDQEWLVMVEPERNNVIAAVEWFEKKDGAEALRMLSTIAPSWQAARFLSGGIDIFDRVLASIPEAMHDLNVANVLRWAGIFAAMLGSLDLATDRLDRASDLFLQFEDIYGRASSLNTLGIVLQNKGEYRNSLMSFESSMEIYESLSNNNEYHGNMYLQLSQCYSNIGNTLKCLGSLDEADTFFAKSITELSNYESEKQKPAPNRYWIFTWTGYGNVAFARRDYDRAEQWYRRCITGSSENDTLVIAAVHHNIACVHYARREFVQARDSFNQALLLRGEVGEKVLAATDMLQLGMIALNESDHVAAYQYLWELVPRCARQGYKHTLVEVVFAAGELAADLLESEIALELWALASRAGSIWKISLESVDFDEASHERRVAIIESRTPLHPPFSFDESKLSSRNAARTVAERSVILLMQLLPAIKESRESYSRLPKDRGQT